MQLNLQEYHYYQANTKRICMKLSIFLTLANIKNNAKRIKKRESAITFIHLLSMKFDLENYEFSLHKPNEKILAKNVQNYFAINYFFN